MQYKSQRIKVMLFLAAVVVACLCLKGLVGQRAPSPPIQTSLESAGPALNPADSEVAVPGDVIFDVKDADETAVLRDLKQHFPDEQDVEKPYSHMDDETMVRVHVSPEEESQVLSSLASDPRVIDAEPDYVATAYGEPNDPLYKYQWNMRKVGAEGAWRGSTGKGVVVAVIDTGVAYENWGGFHRAEDFNASTFVDPYNFITDKKHANDDHSHGTHVAGTIAEATNNDLGAIGLAYDAKIMPLKVLSASGSGTVSDIADAVRYAADKKAQVINMSLGSAYPSKPLHEAVKYAHKKGVCIVCAAGNSSSDKVGYPAGYPECICVSAVRDDNQLTWYSNRGKRIDIAAPGGDLTVDQNDDGYMDGILQNTLDRNDLSKDGYFLYQGTSMASPHVAAAAALLEAMGINDPEAVRDMLKKTANKKDIPDLDVGYGAGILDANAAVFHEVVGDGVMRLFLGFVFVFLVMRTAAGHPYARPGVATFLGMLVGSSGLFFLPYIATGTLPLAPFLCTPVPQWDVAFFGIAAHENPIFYSAMLPLFLGVLFNGRSSLMQRLLIGLNAGIGACLLHAAMTAAGTMRWIPHTWHLDAFWLLINAGVCVLMALGLAEGGSIRRQSQSLERTEI